MIESLTIHPSTGQQANEIAARYVIAEDLTRKSPNSVAARQYDLITYASYLIAIHQSRSNEKDIAANLYSKPQAWSGHTWGVVDGFVKWMLGQGYATATINRKLSTVRSFLTLAHKAGFVPTDEILKIKSIKGYSGKQARNVDERRSKKRISTKKAKPTKITIEQATKLKDQPDTPIGNRDRMLMCLLLDHGLRIGEAVSMKMSNMGDDHFTFYREKVNRIQTHTYTDDTRQSYQKLKASLLLHEKETPLLNSMGTARGYRKRDGSAMTRVDASARVATLGERIGIEISAHDCRHYWSTRASRQGTDAFDLMDAGGWSSIAMPARYVEAAEIANQGVKL